MLSPRIAFLRDLLEALGEHASLLVEHEDIFSLVVGVHKDGVIVSLLEGFSEKGPLQLVAVMNFGGVSIFQKIDLFDEILIPFHSIEPEFDN